MARLGLEDRQFLEKLANLFDLTPERLSRSKTLYNSLAQRIEKEDISLWHRYKTLQKRLGFEPLIPTIPKTTHEIVDIKQAYFHFHSLCLPLEFVKNTLEYQLWKDPSRRLPASYQGTIKYTIPLNKHSVLLIETDILDIIYYPEIIYVKTLHTDKIHYKMDRKNPRIRLSIPCFIKQGKLLRKATMIDLSSKGFAITIEDAPLHLSQEVEIYFSNWICKELRGIVKRRDLYPHDCSRYAIEFSSIPTLTQQKIDSFIYQTMNKEGALR